MVRSCAGGLDQPVARALRLEVVAGLGERQAGRLGQLVDHRRGEAGRGVDAGADRGAAERQLGDPGQRRLEPLDAVADLRGVAAELLAEGDRGGVHQVGAAGLHDRRRTRSALRLQRCGEVVAAPASGR